MKQPVHVAEMKELFGKLGINLLKEFAALPRFQELSQVKKEESEEILPPVEIWNPAVSFKGKTAALWAHLSGRAPFFKAEEVVAAADGHACWWRRTISALLPSTERGRGCGGGRQQIPS